MIPSSVFTSRIYGYYELDSCPINKKEELLKLARLYEESCKNYRDSCTIDNKKEVIIKYNKLFFFYKELKEKTPEIIKDFNMPEFNIPEFMIIMPHL